MREYPAVLVAQLLLSATAFIAGKPSAEFVSTFEKLSSGHFCKSDQPWTDPEPKNKCLLVDSHSAS